MKYFVVGRKWFDKVNGNTYNSAKVWNSDGEHCANVEFAYGYGSDYYFRAVNKIRDMFGEEVAYSDVIDLGSAYITKNEVKNFLY